MPAQGLILLNVFFWLRPTWAPKFEGFARYPQSPVDISVFASDADLRTQIWKMGV